MHIVYRLANGDEILFRAQVRKAGETNTGCSFLKVVRTRREYECQTLTQAAGPGVAFLKVFVIASSPKEATGG